MALVNIRNRYLHDIAWSAVRTYDFEIDGHTDIWRINISDNLAHIDICARLINAAETARANRYVHIRDKNRFIISRAGLRLILSRYLNVQPLQIALETGANKKPYLKNASLQYNVSHSGNWIVIAVSQTAIGVDVEWLNPSFDYHEISTEYFSADEAKYITEHKSHAGFFLLWTRKEALTKATAKGLDDDLKYIPALDGDHAIDAEILKSTFNWAVISFELQPEYCAAAAIIDHTGTIRFRDAGQLNHLL